MLSNYIYDLRAPRAACVFPWRKCFHTALDTRKLENSFFCTKQSANFPPSEIRKKIVFKILVIKRNVATSGSNFRHVSMTFSQNVLLQSWDSTRQTLCCELPFVRFAVTFTRMKLQQIIGSFRRGIVDWSKTFLMRCRNIKRKHKRKTP